MADQTISKAPFIDLVHILDDQKCLEILLSTPPNQMAAPQVEALSRLAKHFNRGSDTEIYNIEADQLANCKRRRINGVGPTPYRRDDDNANSNNRQNLRSREMLQWTWKTVKGSDPLTATVASKYLNRRDPWFRISSHCCNHYACTSNVAILESVTLDRKVEEHLREHGPAPRAFLERAGGVWNQKMAEFWTFRDSSSDDKDGPSWIDACQWTLLAMEAGTSPEDPLCIEPEDNIAKGEGIEEAFAHLEELGLRREAEENGANELGQKLRDFFVAS
ncbi:MAG: hypothetical protein L6R41_006719 [Letrouitia leprolyta]|nr:MAG: hypothetical protein L6R41_006719 [Letrouitia leprolyta]